MIKNQEKYDFNRKSLTSIPFGGPICTGPVGICSELIDSLAVKPPYRRKRLQMPLWKSNWNYLQTQDATEYNRPPKGILGLCIVWYIFICVSYCSYYIFLCFFFFFLYILNISIQFQLLFVLFLSIFVDLKSAKLFYTASWEGAHVRQANKAKIIPGVPVHAKFLKLILL